VAGFYFALEEDLRETAQGARGRSHRARPQGPFLSTYADTSFLVSLYVFDANSVRATSNLSRLAPPIFLTPLIETEMANAFQLRVFRGESSERTIKVSSDLFRRDVQSGIFELKSFGADVFRHASEMAALRTARLGTRTLDLLHVASAVLLKPHLFCTFDQNQAKLARAEGLKVAELI
jgi:predicted nucleic acid-binding protein